MIYIRVHKKSHSDWTSPMVLEQGQRELQVRLLPAICRIVVVVFGTGCVEISRFLDLFN